MIFPKQKLSELLRYCTERSMFYRKRLGSFENLQSYEQWSQIPILRSDEVVENYQDIRCVQKSDIIRIYTTSSTRGTYKIIPFTKEDLINLVAQMKHLLTLCGLRKTDYFVPVFLYGPSTGGKELLQAAEELGIPSTPIDLYNPEALVGVLLKIRPTVMLGLPSTLLNIGHKHQTVFSQHRMRKVFVGGELVTHQTKEELKKLFNTEEVLQGYGGSEVGFVAIGYDPCDHLHLVESDFLFVEIVDPQTGKEVNYQEPGEVVVTTLSHQAFPLLRYSLGDLAVKTNKCACGEEKGIMKILGRADNVLIVGGAIIYPNDIYESCERFATRTGVHITELVIELSRDAQGIDEMRVQFAVNQEKDNVHFQELLSRDLADVNEDFKHILEVGTVHVSGIEIRTKQSLSHKVVFTIKDLRGNY